jgi:fumarate reductase flavoprotein subunit
VSAATNTNKENLQADVVVIGGGGAGLTAAVTAAEKGAKVIVLEKRVLGGNTAHAQGIFAMESRLHKQLNYSGTKDEAFKIAIEYSHWKINPRILRAFINRSDETLSWLEERGLKFERIATVYGGALPTMHCLEPSKHAGWEIVNAMRQRCEELGVKIVLHCPARKILTDDAGGVTGVLAVIDQQECQITADTVIIASGGYGSNKKLLKKYYPQYNEHMQYVGAPNMGDGLLMAINIGAATEGLGTVMVHHQRFPGARDVNTLIRDPSSMWVNKKGERFADETVTRRSVECGNVLARQPDMCVNIILDENIKNNIIEEMRRNMGTGASGSPPRVDLANLDKALQAEVKKGGVMISHSWEEIANWMGVKSETLQNTVDEYNSFCQQGYDEIFNKDRRYLKPLLTPPYYAVKCYMHFLTTMGGIKINHRMEVLNKSDDPIRGLYAAGDCAGGLESDSYCMVLSSSGLGFAINSGRIAGENAVELNLI